MIEIVKEQKAWSSLLESVEHTDVYHTYCYHHLSKKEGESPILIKYTQNDTCVILPLLIRDIKNSSYKDATSVYGYAGILTAYKEEGFDFVKFQNELKDFFLEQKIVAVFSRLHPYIDYQETFLNGMGTIVNPGNVVCIDLTTSLEVQRQKYSRRLKTYLNKSRKHCTVIKGESEEDIESFIDLYYKNMKRVDANGEYFFSKCYFQKLMQSTEYETELLLCIHNQTKAIVGGALFMKTGNIVQYHLSGLDECYYDLNPIKLIIDEMRIRATNEGYNYFNLGGGRGGKEDTLFNFKASFSKKFKPFKLWKFIVDEEAYKSLVYEHFSESKKIDNIYDQGYFPAYRSNIKTAI